MALKRALYLAGGFRSGWQNRVRDRLGPTWEILDPSQHGLADPAAYTAWDLEAIRRSDAVLAVLEASNPGGYALALEMGYAKALGKAVFLVEDPTDPRTRYFDMLRQIVDRRYLDLDQALDELEKPLALGSANRS